jgi:hypothetical protein
MSVRLIGLFILMTSNTFAAGSLLERAGLESNKSRNSGLERVWNHATGGRLSRDHKQQLRFLDSKGALLGFAIYDETGRLRRTLTRPETSSHFTTDAQFPIRSGEPQIVAYFEPKSGRLLRKIVTQAEPALEASLDPLSALECQAPDVLASQPELQNLVRLIDPPPSARHLSCDEPAPAGSGTLSRNYTETAFGMFLDDTCNTGPSSGGLSASTIQQAMTEAVDEGLACLARQGANGIDLAVRLASVMNQGSLPETPSCSSPRPMRIQCGNDACDPNIAVGTTVSSNPEFPRVRINMARIPRLYQCSGMAGFKAAFFHEFLHNAGVRHGEGFDYCYAAATCCFPSAEAAAADGGFRTPEGVSAACRILSQPATDATDSAYLRDLRTTLEAQGRSGHFATTVAFTLAREANTPAARRGGGWTRLILEQSRQALEMGDPVFALALAGAQRARLDSTEPMRSDLEEIIAQARAAGATEEQASSEGVAMIGEAIAAAQHGHLRDAAAVMTRPESRASWDALTDSYGRAVAAGTRRGDTCPSREMREAANRRSSRLYLAKGFLGQIANADGIPRAQRSKLDKSKGAFENAASSSGRASCAE